MLNNIAKCPLCEAKKITPWLYSDSVCFICRCSVHQDQWMVVLRRHALEPTKEELRHIDAVVNHLLPEKRYRGSMTDYPQHWHQHIID